jgi:hypothetical protein
MKRYDIDWKGLALSLSMWAMFVFALWLTA